MNNEIASMELYYLVRELKVLEGSKIDRIYHSKDSVKELTISCHISGEGKKMLKVILPGMILIDDMKDANDTQTGFGMMLRKYLEGGRIANIAQKDFERVITIAVENRSNNETSRYYLIVELFSKGNFIFTDDKFKILNILEEQQWKDRILKRNETYLYPKSKINTLTISEKDFTELLKNSEKESVVKSLAITFNLGGTYSEELCYDSNIDKSKKVKELTDKDCVVLYKNLIILLHEEIEANSIESTVYPFLLESLKSKNDEIKKYSSFSDAIRENYDIIKHTASKSTYNKNAEKIKNIIEEQMKLLKECEDGYSENQAKGELMYEKYQEIDNIMKVVKEARKKYSWNIIKQKLNEHPEFKKILKDIDEKNNSIIIELER